MNKVLTLTLIAGLVSSLSPALADEIIVRDTYAAPNGITPVFVPAQTYLTPTSEVMPSQIVTPLSTTTTTTRRTTVSDVPVVVTPDTITETRRVTVGSAPVSGSSTTILSADVGPYPVYSDRLAAMSEQINKSLLNGWITAAQANYLNAEHDRLASLIAARSASKFDTDMLEKGLTGLNLSIQDAMAATRATAGLSPMQ